MKYADVVNNVKELLAKALDQTEFVFELLLAYGTPKATIAPLKNGQLNLAKDAGEVLLKKKRWHNSTTPTKCLTDFVKHITHSILPLIPFTAPRPYDFDQERLEHLFKSYEAMIEEEKMT